MILGGAGSISGVIIAALIVNGVPELLRNPNNGRYVFYVGLILVHLVLPEVLEAARDRARRR